MGKVVDNTICNFYPNAKNDQKYWPANHSVSVMQNSLFPGSGLSGSVGSLTFAVDDSELPDTSDPSGGNHQQYLRELERIRTEIAGFQPIEHPLERASKTLNGKTSSLDDDPFTGDDYFWLWTFSQTFCAMSCVLSLERYATDIPAASSR